MSKKDISYYINKDEKIITCKKRAKFLLSIAKEKKEQISLTQCQNIAAQELGFKNWFDLHYSLKLKYSPFVIKEFFDLSKMFDDLLLEALKNDSTDLHFELREEKTIVKFRVQGEMHPYQSYDSIQFKLFINHMYKHIFKINNDNLQNPQVKVDYLLKNHNIKLLCQSVPTYPYGADIILRMKNLKKNSFVSLSELGYSSQQIEDFISCTSLKKGGLLIGGHYSGQQNLTAYTLINDFSKKSDYKNNILTIEEVGEVEFELSNVEQKLMNKEQTDFQEILNHNFKKVPKLLMLGHIYSKNSFNLFNDLINKTSVIATFPIHSSFGALDRLRDFHYRGNHINITGIAYQQLLPVICPHCSIKINYIDNNQSQFENDQYLFKIYQKIKKSYSHIDCSSIRFINKEGCSHCKYRGTVGTTICCEFLPVNQYVQKFIQLNDEEGLKKYWTDLSDNNPFSENMRGKFVKDHAIYKMLHGMICPQAISANFMDF